MNLSEQHQLGHRAWDDAAIEKNTCRRSKRSAGHSGALRRLELDHIQHIPLHAISNQQKER